MCLAPPSLSRRGDASTVHNNAGYFVSLRLVYTSHIYVSVPTVITLIDVAISFVGGYSSNLLNLMTLFKSA